MSDTSLVAKTLATQLLLVVVLPLNLIVCAVGRLRGRRRPRRRVVVDDPKTVLVTGGKMTKALQLARSFHDAGHEVVLVESGHYRWTGHRFSNSVRSFHVVPDSGDPAYVDALVRIVQTEDVDVIVPVCSPAASRHDAAAKELLSQFCEVVHVDAETVDLLDDKYQFARAAESFGLSVPDTHRITDPDQVVDFDFAAPERAGRTYVLKSIAYDPIRRLDLTALPRPTGAETAAFARSLPISHDNPWILQEFIEGREYCTHGTVRGGNLQMYCCCASSAFQINYEMVDKPEIERWVRTFVEALGMTGQASFDFIETTNGELYAIECNPRTHSAITMFYDHPDVACSYLEDGVAMITPTVASKPTYWLYHEVWRMLTKPSTARERLAVIRRGKDAIFDRHDPLPFLLVHHLQIPALLAGNLRDLRDWIRIDFNIGKLVEPGGD